MLSRDHTDAWLVCLPRVVLGTRHEHPCVLVVRHEELCAAQGLWKGVLPSLVMVANPTVNYMLYEVLLARLAELKRRRRGIPTGEHLSRGDAKHKNI